MYPPAYAAHRYDCRPVRGGSEEATRERDVSDKSKIEWTEATWNPVTGCTKVSPGCDHCYAETLRRALARHAGPPLRARLRRDAVAGAAGDPAPVEAGRKIFVNSMSDVFHEAVPDEFIARMFAVMAGTPQHTYQVLTKRHARMRSLLNSQASTACLSGQFHELAVATGPRLVDPEAGAQLAAAERLARRQRRGPEVGGHPHPGAARDPGRRAVRERRAAAGPDRPDAACARGHRAGPRLNPSSSGGICCRRFPGWTGSSLAGSRAGARPMDPGWARWIVQCEEAEAAVFVKQLGAVLGHSLARP